MTETDDRLLREFLAPARREVADNGFSNRVMQQLATNARQERRFLRLTRLWTLFCCALALGLLLHIDGFRLYYYGCYLREVFISSIESAATNLDPLSLLIAVVVLMVLACRKIVTLA